VDSIKSLYDLFGIRIIVNDEITCYKVLWLVHKNWIPLPKRFKDYIALPKPNGYKSIHTTVIWLIRDYRQQPTEIQIKTCEMKEFSDIWVAAHFEYKEKGSIKATGIDWVKELKELTWDLENNDFVSSLKIDVFKDRIFVFTPKWDLINLPVGSTSIDFAYYVHSNLWDKISIVKINWEVKTLDKELHNWDIIDIITDKNKKPNPFWLSFVKTTKAKNRIKSFLKRENKDLYRERGKDILEKYLEKTGIFELDKELSLLKVLEWRENKMEERWAILEQIWNFSLPVSSIFKKILKAKNITLEEDNKKQSRLELWKETKVINKKIIIGWEENLDYILWECCDWKIPKKIVAHINRDSKITIHRRDCEIIKDVNKDRLLSAYELANKWNFLEVNIILTVLNKKWILKSISDIIYTMEINIEEINFSKKFRSQYKWNISLTLEVSDYDYLIIDRLIDRIKNCLWDDLVWFRLKNIK
jgi:GTP pyrophosphokinase